MTDPCTRLFLSVDVVGSTAYKQTHARGDDVEVTWPELFLVFFQEFPAMFAKELQEVTAKINAVRGFPERPTDPVLWKAIGDELVLWQKVDHELQVTAAVIAWRNTLDKYRRANIKDSDVDVKGTAWIATFPSPNREIAIPRSMDAAAAAAGSEPIAANEANLLSADGPGANFAVDFLGPNIDLGFRLGARSTPRKFIVALKVADIVAAGLEQLDSGAREELAVRFFYDGLVDLKGVAGGPYPILWIDSMPDNAFMKAEDLAADGAQVKFPGVAH